MAQHRVAPLARDGLHGAPPVDAPSLRVVFRTPPQARREQIGCRAHIGRRHVRVHRPPVDVEDRRGGDGSGNRRVRRDAERGLDRENGRGDERDDVADLLGEVPAAPARDGAVRDSHPHIDSGHISIPPSGTASDDGATPTVASSAAHLRERGSRPDVIRATRCPEIVAHEKRCQTGA
jgi:hypothetical protein